MAGEALVVRGVPQDPGPITISSTPTLALALTPTLTPTLTLLNRKAEALDAPALRLLRVGLA